MNGNKSAILRITNKLLSLLMIGTADEPNVDPRSVLACKTNTISAICVTPPQKSGEIPLLRYSTSDGEVLQDHFPFPPTIIDCLRHNWLHSSANRRIGGNRVDVKSSCRILLGDVERRSMKALVYSSARA
jgi:hypothetical protein